MLPCPAERRRPRADDGFSLIEVAFVVTLILMVSAIGFPAFNQTMRKVRTEGHLQEVTHLLMLAQREAMRRGVPVVAEARPGTNEIVVWANVDRDATLSYDPDSAAAPRTSDYEVARYEADPLTKVTFMSPAGLEKGGGKNKATKSNKGGGKKGGGKDDGGNDGNDKGGGKSSGAWDGLTTLGSGSQGVVFERDGSVRDVGALRLGDEWGNFFEVRVEPQATGRIQLLKYRADPPSGSPAGFYPRGTDPESGLPYWEWSTIYQTGK